MYELGLERLEERRSRLRRVDDVAAADLAAHQVELIAAIRAEENRGRVEILETIAREHKAQLAAKEARIAELEREVQVLRLRRQTPMVYGVARVPLHGRN